MTIKRNAENERVKRSYFDYLAGAKGFDETTIDGHAKAIARFEQHTNARAFKRFHIEQAKSFRETLAKAKNGATGKPLSKSTIQHALAALRAFFIWLASQPGYRKIGYSDADYFPPSLKDARAVATQAKRPYPSLDQVKHVISRMPSGTDIEKRDRAIVAFVLLTGARDRAVTTLQLKHVDLAARRVNQDGAEVATKASKTIETWFFPVGAEIEEIVVYWVKFLRTEKKFGETDPLFPATKVAPDAERRFAAAGLDCRFWTTADPIRRIFRTAFAAAGLPYHNPHSLRDTLTQLGERICPTREHMKAWSQNLGHEHLKTTHANYAPVTRHRQSELILELGEGHGPNPSGAALDAFVAALAPRLGISLPSAKRDDPTRGAPST